MNGAAPAASPSAGASLAAVAIGALTAALGYVAALAEGVATAPTAWSGVAAIGVIALGAALAVLGAASLAVPRLRPAAGKGAVAVALALAGLYIVGQILTFTGLHDA